MTYYVVIGNEDRYSKFSGNSINTIRNNFIPKDTNETHEVFRDTFEFFVGFAFSPEELNLIEPFPNSIQIDFMKHKIRFLKRIGTKPDNHQFFNVGKYSSTGIWQSGIKGDILNIIREKAKQHVDKSQTIQTSTLSSLKNKNILK